MMKNAFIHKVGPNILGWGIEAFQAYRFQGINGTLCKAIGLGMVGCHHVVLDSIFIAKGLKNLT